MSTSTSSRKRASFKMASNDNAVDEAMELFNSFQLAGDVKDKAGLLKSLAEVAIRRHAVLDEQSLLSRVLESRADPAPNVRKAILDFWDTCMAEVKELRVDQVREGAALVVALLADENAAVVKRAITSLLVILRWHFSRDSEGELSEVVLQGLKKVEELCQDDGSATGIKLGASKVLEQAITSPTKQNAHQKALNGMLMCFVKLLKKLKAAEITGPLAVSCLRSCRSILQARPQLAGKLVPVMLSFGQVDAYKNAKTATAIDECLRGFILSGSQLAKPWARKVNDCLVSLGRDPLPDDGSGKRPTTNPMSVADRSAAGAGAGASTSNKRARTGVYDDSKDVETRIRARIENYDADGLFDLILSLPRDVAIEMALDALTSTTGVPRLNTVSQDVIAVRMCNLMLEALQSPSTMGVPQDMSKKQDVGTGRGPISKKAGASTPPPPVMRVREFKDPLAAPAALTSEQSSHQRLQALRRIMRGSGAAKARLVARLAALFPVTDNAFETVVSTIMQDYEGNEGHETFNLLLLMLFLEGEDGDDADDGANGDGAGQANERYESALQVIFDGMREALPHTEKKLADLLNEIPLLPPEMTAAFVESLLQDEDSSKNSVGLVICRDVVLTRLRCRQKFLDLVMKSCTSSNEELRKKAIRMCTNQLYAEDVLQLPIEAAAAGFLKEAVERAIQQANSAKNAKSTKKEGILEEKGSAEMPERPEAEDIKQDEDGKPDEQEDKYEKDRGHATEEDNPDRLINLYCALTTKKSSLLQAIFQAYGVSPLEAPLRATLLERAQNIADTIGPSDKNILSIIEKPPPGSEDLVLCVLSSFTVEMPGRPLVTSVISYFEEYPTELNALVPILPGLRKNDAIKLVPSLIQLPEAKLIEAIMRLCTIVYQEQNSPVITPAELLTLLHMVDDRKLLKSTITAINVCLGMGTIFTSEVLAASLSQLITRIPLPQLFMRTVIQSISVAPKLRGFIVDLLGQLIGTQIWTNGTQWKGWIMAAQQTAPESFPVILRLPPSVLDQALAGLQKETRSGVVERGLKEPLPENVLNVLTKHR